MKTIFSLAVLGAIASAEMDVNTTSIGRLNIEKPAFMHVTSYARSEEFLLTSSFKAFGSGAIKVVPEVRDAIVHNDLSTLKVYDIHTDVSFKWPNDCRVVDEGVFAPGTRSIVVPDGFLVPGHTNGGVYIIEMDDQDITKSKRTVEISTLKKGYFYHMGHWIDMNGDGRKDFLTARANAKKDHGELVWFEQPEGGLDTPHWTEHVVTKGPDVETAIAQYPEQKDVLFVYGAEFFNEKLSLTRVSLKDGSLIDYNVIDDKTILHAYQAELV